MENNEFLPQKGGYRKLRCYQIAECIYDVTFWFANNNLKAGDRTIDQRVQAARSGKQYIAEGSAASTTSREMEIRLTNVAKSSLQELLIDYEDFLRVRNLQLWDKDSPKALQTRRVCAQNSDSSFYREAIKERTPETVANIAIVLINQCDYLLKRLIEAQKQQFLEQGGIKEQMSAARRNHRGY